MRVLLATDTLPTPPRGGLDLHVCELVESLPSRGVTVQVAPLSSLHLRHVLRDARPDIVHFHSLQGLPMGLPEAAKRSGAAVVWTLHDFHSICPRTHLHDRFLRPCSGPREGRACGPCFGGLRRLAGGPFYRRRFAAMRTSLDACDQLIAPSEFVKRQFTSEGIESSKLQVIAPAVRAPHAPARVPTPNTRARFVYAGDLRRSKGALTLLRAARQLDGDFEIVLHGGAPAPPAPREAKFERELRAASKGQAVHYQGRYAPGDLSGLLNGALALIVPSLVRESFGRTANEALLCRVPVIAANEGGLAGQIVEGVNGWLFEPGSAESLAEAMERMLRKGGPMSLRNGQTNGRSWPTAPDFESELDRLVSLYEACL